jgi:hypothetical protein
MLIPSTAMTPDMREQFEEHKRWVRHQYPHDLLDNILAEIDTCSPRLQEVLDRLLWHHLNDVDFTASVDIVTDDSDRVDVYHRYAGDGFSS